MKTFEVSINNRRGLHTRACAEIVKIASHFHCHISIVSKGRRASASNIIAVMMLSATVGGTVRLEAEGPEEAAAMREIAALFQDGYGEWS